jgi:transposase
LINTVTSNIFVLYNQTMKEMSKRRDFIQMETRRMEAARLLRRGIHAAEVARQVGVSRTSVHRWEKELSAGGLRGLKKAGRAGRKPQLDVSSRNRIAKRIKAGALQSGYATDLWTLSRIGALIKEETGVRYSPSGVWRLLSAMGFSSQKPATKAIQRNEPEIEHWKSKRWPLLKKTPAAKDK